jgi:hypothetical protein
VRAPPGERPGQEGHIALLTPGDKTAPFGHHGALHEQEHIKAAKLQSQALAMKGRNKPRVPHLTGGEPDEGLRDPTRIT